MTEFKGSCHCGAVSFVYPKAPEFLTQCNCSLCRRVSALWAYEARENVVLHCGDDATISYIQGDKTLATHSCVTCGCTTHWLSIDGDGSSRMSVNFRMCDPEVISEIPVRHFDGAHTWEFLD